MGRGTLIEMKKASTKVVNWLFLAGFISVIIYVSIMGLPWERTKIVKKVTIDAMNQYVQLFNVDKVRYWVFQNKYIVYLSSEDNTIKVKVTVYASKKNEDGKL